MLCSSNHLGRKGLLPENGDEKGDSDQYLVSTHNARLVMKLSEEGIAQTALVYFFRCKRARLSF
jgi:hypothetical protein